MISPRRISVTRSGKIIGWKEARCPLHVAQRCGASFDEGSHSGGVGRRKLVLFMCEERIVRLPISQLSRESIARTQFAGFHFHLRPMPNNTILTVTSNQLSLRDPACPRNFHVQYLLKTQFLKRKKSYLSFRYRLQNSFGYCWESRP